MNIIEINQTCELCSAKSGAMIQMMSMPVKLKPDITFLQNLYDKFRTKVKAVS